jgi:integrase
VPRGVAQDELPRSGLPGLRWRQRGGGGTWVVSLAVPKQFRDRVVNRAGNPLTRLERSTGTDSLKQAKELYPKLMSQLRQELAERAGTALLESKQDAALRVVGGVYESSAAPEAIAQHNVALAFAQEFMNSASNLPLDKLQVLLEGHRALLAELARHEFAQAGLPLNETELPQAVASVKTAALAARDLHQARQEVGYLAEASPVGKQLSKAAAAPLPVSIFEIAEKKKERLSDRTYENLLRTCKNWQTIIGEVSLNSITSSHLNYFARTLNQPKPTGYGYSTDNANNEAARLRSLLKFYNEHQKDDSARITYPEWERIVVSGGERKQKVRLDKERATNKDDVKRLLDWAYLEEKDKYAWLYVLLIDNTTFRNEEACRLRWGEIICQDGIWCFDLDDAKTAAGIRRIPLNSRLLRYLLPLKGPDDEFVINNKWPLRRSPKDAVGNFLRKAKQTLNITTRINAHAFRHGAGGDLGYNQTEHIKKLLLGHAGNVTDHYTRHDWRKLREAVETIGTPWEPPSSYPPYPLEIRFTAPQP